MKFTVNIFGRVISVEWRDERSFSVYLTNYGGYKFGFFKEYREANLDLTLREVKEIFDAGTVLFKQGITKDEALKVVGFIECHGGKAKIK